MGSGGKAGKKAAGAVIGVSGGGGGHADGPGGVAGGPTAGPLDVSAPVTMVSPVLTGPVADMHTQVAQITAAAAMAKPTAAGVVSFVGTSKPLAKMFQDAYGNDPAYEALGTEQKSQLWAAAKDAAKGYLDSVPKVELQKAAAASGFQYPHLIGKTDPKGSALAFVLNPFYTGATAQKAKEKIQAKALYYYSQLSEEEKKKADAEAAALAAAAGAPDALDVDSLPAGHGGQTGGMAGPPDQQAAGIPGQPAAAIAGAPDGPTGPQATDQTPKVALPKLIANIKTSFTDLLKSLAGLALTKKAAGDLPPWRGKEAVQKLVFHHEGNASHLGGVHEKHIYRSPDGQRWLFKPDKKAGGAVAAAEEAAAEIARRAGMPAVEVRRVTIGGKVGSIQPLAGDPGKLQPLPADPAQWTPQQRAAVMAQHVVDWLLGDHDGNHTNFILAGNTPVRIDRGQAFKFYGQDTLTLDYEPNKVHGAPPHATIALYRAAKAGKVAVNPLLLAPVIQAVESMPDAELRQILRPASEAGVKGKAVEWYGAMEQRAAVKTGKANPPPDAVAEAFLDAVVARKHNIRQDFEGLFSAILGQPFAFPAAEVPASAPGTVPATA